MHAVLPLLQNTGFPALHRGRLDTLQINLGYRCNQSCLHCHVNASPKRNEAMDEETLGLVLRVLVARRIGTLDLTGGAPELHRDFRDLVGKAYMRLLKESYSAANLDNVMCRNLVSVDWQGYLYDCDFNQQLGLALPGGKGRAHLRDLLQTGLCGNPVHVADHCYGCTAGQGSSCGGALHGRASP